MNDYVIVGAGSAGCVLANRLSADPGTRVLLLEAGGEDTRDAVQIPAAFGQNFKTVTDWNYQTQPEKHLHARRLYWPRGKVLGGSSSINAMIYIRGNRRDYDSWGLPGWSYADVLPYFKRAEHNERGADEYHGVDGPLNVADQRGPSPMSLAFVEACAQAGFARNPDFNGARQEGAGLYQVTQRGGRRLSAYRAYVHPVRDRPNLEVQTDALVERVRFDGRRATGVVYRRHGQRQEVGADAEVVVCGGAVNSPQLLMLSGVGPAHHLREHGIDIVADVPGVGENLQDHPATALLEHSGGPSLTDAQKPLQMLAFYLRGKGMLTSNVGEGGLFVRTRDDLDAPDIQFHFAPVAFEDHGLTEPFGHGYTMGVTLVAPRSRGHIRLRSADPTWKPAITANYLEAEEDLESLVAGLRLARELSRQSSLAAWRRGEYLPGATVDTEEGLREYARARAETLYHPTSTCRMGDDERSVTDAELKVHGVEGLRVVDASAMPGVVRGNTNAPTIMIAERGADLILGRPVAQRPELATA